jgi:hypothetical protein
MCRSKINLPARTVVVTLLSATALAGCSGLYMDRGDTIALSAGDAIAANEAAQMYDPWPAHSRNVNYPANGQKMQTAVERYRTNVVTQPVSATALQGGNPSLVTVQTTGSQNASQGAPASTSSSTAGSSTTTTASGQ